MLALGIIVGMVVVGFVYWKWRAEAEKVTDSVAATVDKAVSGNTAGK